ncbi:MAG: hypothetical protein ABIQ32_12150 [Sphingomicrobium sp.]
MLSPSNVFAQKAQITGLSDLSFGSISNVTVDAVRNENVCVYANGSNRDYTVRATGSGSGSAFTLANGSLLLPYEVQWKDSAGQTTGSQLTTNVALANQITSASSTTCSSGPAATASLIVILRASALASATAGNYSGVLTLTVAPQ